MLDRVYFWNCPSHTTDSTTMSTMTVMTAVMAKPMVSCVEKVSERLPPARAVFHVARAESDDESEST